MRFKRNNGLIAVVNSMLEHGDNLTGEQKDAIAELKRVYENATYAENSDRHKFYQETVEDMVNDSAFKDDELAEKMANNHPTLQQNFMRMCLKFIRKMANKSYYDDRNKASVDLAKKMEKAADEVEFAYIPHI